ncbi:uncharacterized protein YukE [Saccharothrix coeruleofusca]|uniref:hypothetical protein n=1 Tax=Saccharothrix coeruleofusca TaxID=33919 RepID=UPI001AE87F2C|nr:hypothetical protein [Saccharothrix coeruleofusca]MBP2334565.1 uncharacterized protein YukE [Saccharothrix coeruleofusca]
MAFAVQPAALRGCAELLSGQVNEAGTMRSYAQAEIDAKIGWGGLLAVLGEVYPTVVDELGDSLNKTSHLLNSSAAALTSTAEMYESTDHNSAVALDSTMPGKERGAVLPADQREPATPFTPRRDPSGRLAAPGEYSGQFRWQMDILDAVGLSITAFVRQTLVSTAGWDPFEPVMRDWTGDWAKIRSVADAWHSVRSGFEDLSVNVVQAAQDLSEQWTGNAAGECLTYLQRLSESLYGQAEFCRYVRDKLVEAADGAAEMYKAASGLVSTAIDWAITATVAAGAGTATVQFYGIGVAGWVLAGIAVERVITMMARVANMISNFKNTLEGLAGLLKNIQGTSFDGYRVAHLPLEPYTPPGR